MEEKSKPTNPNSDANSSIRFNKDERDDLLSDPDDNELVKLGVDMSQLSDYMDNIVKVVNQHAKLLDKVSDELECRPKQMSVGELFGLLSHAFPYERHLKQLGYTSHPPRNAKVIDGLNKHKISLNTPLSMQQE